MSPENRPISPELVLVDPSLAGWARDQLPPTPDTVSQLSVARATRRSEPAREAPRRRGYRLVPKAGVLMLLAATGFLVGSRAIPERASPTLLMVAENPPTTATASASRSVSETPTLPEHQPTTATARASGRVKRPSTNVGRPRRPSKGTQVPSRRFAWAPSPGASGYHVELFRGSALIFRAETKRPEVVIRRRWRLNGRDRRLEPGAYRWYVWPIGDGRRKAKAIVQAKVVVPG